MKKFTHTLKKNEHVAVFFHFRVADLYDDGIFFVGIVRAQ